MTRSVFALEMCLRYDPELAAGVRAMLTGDTTQPSPGHLWNLWNQTVTGILRRKAAWMTGCWDFFEEPAKAQSDFQMWAKGLLTAEGARKAPSGSAEPYRGAERFMTLTMACLLVKGSVAERTLAGVCNIPEAYLWHRASFERILAGVPHINFAVVDRATLYLIPKEDGWALTAEDMRDPKFQYLRPIV